MLEIGSISTTDWAALKRLRRTRPIMERCELCALELPSRHAHLLELKARRIACACDACALLFEADTSPRYRRVPRDVLYLSNFAIEDFQWEALSIPISLVFFFFSSAVQRVTAIYPSPAGATESLLLLDTWQEIAARHPRLERMQPDVEAFLVNRVSAPGEHYIAPIDRCYELTGIVRRHWRGFSGSEELWRQVKEFFTGLREEARIVHA
jgi:uncharacterized protein DUF5947